MGTQEPSRGENLTPEQHRGRLIQKLNCLIAVLEVAIQKVQRSQSLPGESKERLEKIRGNLENTLAICRRARTSLEGRTAESKGMGPLPPAGIVPLPRPPKSRMSYRDYVELSSVKEFQKFKQLPPIGLEEVRGQDLEDLIRKLLAG